MGAHFIKNLESTQVRQETRNAIAHKYYDEENISDDIGVLIFDVEFPLTGSYFPARVFFAVTY